MLRKKVKLLLEQLQVFIFAEIVFGVRCTLKKMPESQIRFFHQSRPVSLKAWTFALNIAGVEKIRSENLRLRSTLEAILFKF